RQSSCATTGAVVNAATTSKAAKRTPTQAAAPLWPESTSRFTASLDRRRTAVREAGEDADAKGRRRGVAAAAAADDGEEARDETVAVRTGGAEDQVLPERQELLAVELVVGCPIHHRVHGFAVHREG